MKYIILIFSFFIWTSAFAQNIKKGFKNLEKKEYDKAKESFQKNLEENKTNPGANFGMALALADDESAVFSIIDSWEFADMARKNIDKLSQDDIEIISEYFLNSEARKTSYPVKRKIENALEAVEARLIKYIREENNLEAVYEVLKRYPDFRHYDNVIHIRNQFEFRKYEIMNTLEGYKEFLSKFPEAAQVDKANRYVYKLSFEKARETNTVAAYNEYIRTYPKSEHIQTVIKLRNTAAFNDCKTINTLQAYEQFIAEYPDALEIADARSKVQDLLYEQAKRIKSLEAYNDFIKKYPDGKLFIDIFNLKAEDLGAQVLKDYNISSASIEWARGFDDNGKVESGGVVAVTNEGEYIIACNSRTNDTSFSDVWVIKLDKLGKMIWNKYVGQQFDDKVSAVLLDSKGDILVTGYTWLSEDSASNVGWMFKLGADGRKLWNKNLGKTEINAFAIDQNNRIFVGGSIMDDSLGIGNYMLDIYNNEAKKVAEREFTGYGTINDIDINQNGQLLVSGSNWLCQLDNRRYILWDDTLKYTLKSTNCAYNTDGYYFTGYGNESVFYAKYLTNGKKAWFHEFPKTDPLQVSVDIVAIAPTSVAVAEQKTNGAKIKYLGSDGKVIKVIEINGPIQINDLSVFEKGLSVVATDGNLIIVKYLSDTTL